jgi:hypothetical protein
LPEHLILVENYRLETKYASPIDSP